VLPSGKEITMTPLLKAWKADADEFGIPETTQRGLAFMLALSVSVFPPSEDQTECLEIMCSINPLLYSIPGNMGMNYDGATIASLLAELSCRLEDKSPVVTSSQGVAHHPFARPIASRLPLFNAEKMTLATFYNLLTSLYYQIGTHINEKVPAAYLAGHRFVAAYGELDQEATVHVARLAVSLAPPHLMWFLNAWNFSPSKLTASGPLAKILTCFMGNDWNQVACEAPQVFEATHGFSNNLNYSSNGQKIEAIWAADLPAFARLAASCQLQLHELAAEPEWLRENRAALLAQGFEPPPRCSSREEVYNVLNQQILARWGYDVIATSDSPYPAEQWLRRCCVMFMCTVNAFLRPDWNAALARR